MNYLTPDLFAAWLAGGMRAYCYLRAAHAFAVDAKDFVAAAELDWLEDVLNVKTATELTTMEVAA